MHHNFNESLNCDFLYVWTALFSHSLWMIFNWSWSAHGATDNLFLFVHFFLYKVSKNVSVDFFSSYFQRPQYFYKATASNWHFSKNIQLLECIYKKSICAVYRALNRMSRVKNTIRLLLLLFVYFVEFKLSLV